MTKQYPGHLPHWNKEGNLYFVTWRLTGSSPRVDRFDPKATPGERFLREDRSLDTKRSGPQWLKDPAAASAVVKNLLEGELAGRYELGDWVLMPNHVHVVMRPAIELSKVMAALKACSARDANRILGRAGKPFWAREYFDRLIRDRYEEARIRRYIENNPVKAGLCACSEDWVWSSTHAAIAASPLVCALRTN